MSSSVTSLITISNTIEDLRGRKTKLKDLRQMAMELVPIRGFIKGTDKFPIQKCAIFRKFKEIKELRGGILLYAAQAIPPIDAEIAEKGHLWTETS
jgi:hypothetical protein